MFIKRILILLIFSLCSFVLCSCDMPSIINHSSSEYNPSNWSADDYPFAEKTMLEVLRCLDENDNEAFKTLFSESVLSAANIDHQIENAITFYEGKSVSHNDIHCEIKASNYSIDHYEYKSIRVTTDNVITDSSDDYNIEFWYVLVDEEDSSQIGISKFIFRDMEGVPILIINSDGGKYVN